MSQLSIRLENSQEAQKRYTGQINEVLKRRDTARRSPKFLEADDDYFHLLIGGPRRGVVVNLNGRITVVGTPIRA